MFAINGARQELIKHFRTHFKMFSTYCRAKIDKYRIIFIKQIEGIADNSTTQPSPSSMNGGYVCTLLIT